jgi:hypothetical protein
LHAAAGNRTKQAARPFGYQKRVVCRPDKRLGSLFVSYFYDRALHLALVSKETKQSTVDFTSFAEDTHLAGYPVDPAELNPFVYGNELIIPLDPSDIIDYAAEHPEAADRIREAIKYVNADQNPVLLIVTI